MPNELNRTNETLLACEHVDAGWDESQVLSDVCCYLPEGETLAVLGRNGVGKTTLLSAIAGRALLQAGRISYGGQSIAGMPKYARARKGIGLVPQEREVFPSLTVQENLVVATSASGRNDRPSEECWSVDQIFDIFPRLRERRRNRGDQLSGGEQQMLSIARALMGNPKLLLLDEPMEGLAPVIVDQLIEALHEVSAQARLSMLIVEQHAAIAREFTKRIMVLDRGAVVYDNSSGHSQPDMNRIEQLIGLG